MKKKCMKCKEEKETLLFNKNKRKHDGLSTECKDCVNLYNKAYREVRGYTEEIKLYNKSYGIKNRKKLNKKSLDRKNNNINIKISHRLRSRLLRAIEKNLKSGSAVGDLGCPVEYFTKEYIPSKFYDNYKTGEIMTWDNYGLYGWHLDHIIPLSSFDLTDRKQLLKACHYTNLQPLWWQDNLSKGARNEEGEIICQVTENL